MCVWNEDEREKRHDRSERRSDNEHSWVCKASLVDFRQAVNDVKFAPRHLGLKLVGLCADALTHHRRLALAMTVMFAFTRLQMS